MSNFKTYCLQYKKLVNNVTNQGSNGNQISKRMHKMKQKDNNDFALFYKEFQNMELQLEKEGMQTIIDLQYYINWLRI